MVATVPMFTDLTVLARLLRHRHAACRSALVRAALLRLRTPPQHDDGSALAFPVAYGMHGASAEPTCPHVMAADADATSAAAAMTTANATTACILLFFIIKAIVVVLLLSIAPAKLSKCCSSVSLDSCCVLWGNDQLEHQASLNRGSSG